MFFVENAKMPKQEKEKKSKTKQSKTQNKKKKAKQNKKQKFKIFIMLCSVLVMNEVCHFTRKCLNCLKMPNRIVFYNFFKEVTLNKWKNLHGISFWHMIPTFHIIVDKDHRVYLVTKFTHCSCILHSFSL